MSVLIELEKSVPPASFLINFRVFGESRTEENIQDAQLADIVNSLSAKGWANLTLETSRIAVLKFDTPNESLKIQITTMGASTQTVDAVERHVAKFIDRIDFIRLILNWTALDRVAGFVSHIPSRITVCLDIYHVNQSGFRLRRPLTPSDALALESILASGATIAEMFIDSDFNDFAWMKRGIMNPKCKCDPRFELRVRDYDVRLEIENWLVTFHGFMHFLSARGESHASRFLRRDGDRAVVSRVFSYLQ